MAGHGGRMFAVFKNLNNNSFYVIPHRSGSTYFREIVENTPVKDYLFGVDFHNISCILDVLDTPQPNGDDLKSFLSSINKKDSTINNTTINIIFRNPIDRYKSGLHVSTVTRSFSAKYKQLSFSDGFVNNDDMKLLFHIFESALKQHSKEGDLTSIFHFNDSHTDHVLWLPAVLLFLGFNVKLIHIDDYTSFLLSEFPEANDYILANKMQSSMRSNIRNSIYWAVYDELVLRCQFLRDNPQFLIRNSPFKSWEEWMEPELKLYNLFNKNIDNLTTDNKQYLNFLLTYKHYWYGTAPRIETLRIIFSKDKIKYRTKLPDTLRFLLDDYDQYCMLHNKFIAKKNYS